MDYDAKDLTNVTWSGAEVCRATRYGIVQSNWVCPHQR